MIADPRGTSSAPELRELLGTYRNRPAGQYRAACPYCDKPRDTALRIKVERDHVHGHCYRCEAWAIYREDSWAIYRMGNCGSKCNASATFDPDSPAPVERTAEPLPLLSDYGRQLWQASQPLAGAALAYLEARQCRLPPALGALRWHPKLRHAPTGYEGPALLALVTDSITGEPLTLHRTWINADGTKAADPARLLLKGCRKAGGVIRLWPDEAVTQGLAIAEGIETALSVAHCFTPVWSAIDAGNLGEFPVLAGIEALTVVADNDPAGLRAAEACAVRWSAAGREVRIVTPQTDANDLVRAA